MAGVGAFDPLAASGGSKQAWQPGQDMYDNDPETAKNVPGVQGHDDAPAAMESEVCNRVVI